MFLLLQSTSLDLSNALLHVSSKLFSMKNLHQKIIEKKWKIEKSHIFLFFYWKSWKVINLWIFRIFSDSWKCIIRISFNANYMKLSAFESLWHILYRNNKKIIVPQFTLLSRGIEDRSKLWKIAIFMKFHIFQKNSKNLLPQW